MDLPRDDRLRVKRRDTARAMSQQNVEIVRSLFSSFEQIGPEGTFRFLSPDIEWEVRPDLPDSRTYRGHNGVRELLATFEDVLDEQWYSPRELIPAGDLVVVPLRWGGRGKTSGVRVEEREETWVESPGWDSYPCYGIRDEGSCTRSRRPAGRRSQLSLGVEPR